MALLTIQTVATTGLNPTYAAATAGGDQMINDDRTMLHVKNGGAGAVQVTITKVRQVVRKEGYGDIALSDIVVSVPAGAERMISAPPAAYADSNGLANISYDQVTSVTVAALKRAKD